MEVIHFCTDGVLRRSVTILDPTNKNHKSRLVPLQAWEQAVDPAAFLSALHANILFDVGLTVGHLMENLEPWGDTVTGLARMDFAAFLAEMHRQPEDPVESVAHIALRYSATVSPVPAYERSRSRPRKLKSGFYRFNPGKRLFSGRLNLVEGWENHALLRAEFRDYYNGAESISLGFTSLADWKHLPILIEDTGVLDDETVSPGSAQFLGTRKPLTRRDHPNVEFPLLPDGRAASHRIRIDAPLPTLFDTVIRGFLWDLGFHYSPATRDRTRDDLRKQIAGIDAGDPDATRADYEQQRALEFEAGMARLAKAEEAATRLRLALRENASEAKR